MNKHIFILAIICSIYSFAYSQSPLNLSGIGYKTTVHLQWNEYLNFQPIGYNIYRSTESENFSSPSRKVGAYTDYTDYNLLPNTDYFYKISAFDANGNETELSEEITVSTNDLDYLKVASLDLLIPIYTEGMSATAPEEIMKGLEFSRGIFYRNSFCQLNLKFHYMIIDGYPPLNNDGVANFNTIGADLTARGILNDQYDAIHVEALKLYGWYGGAKWLGETAGSMSYNWTGYEEENHYTRGEAWVFTHEFGHSLDLVIAKNSGYPEMVFNHYAWAHPMIPEIGVFDAGENFDGMALVLRLFEHHLNYKAPYDGYIEVVDMDNDGFADDDIRLYGDENRYGSNPNAYDSDDDGLSDLGEYTADVYQGTDPNNIDTDGDSIEDGLDAYPASNFQPICEKTTQLVNINGVLNDNEGWNEMGAGSFYSKIPDASLTAHATWDDNYLYFAFESNQHLKYYLLIDGNGKDGIFSSSVKWTGGDYAGINPNAWGISYFDQASLIIRADDTQVYKKGEPINGSAVVTSFSNGVYITEIKLPHNLGPGFGYNYVAPSAPEISELIFSENDTLGIQLIASPLSSSNLYEWDDWKVKDWLILNQPFHYYDMVLTENDDPTSDYCDSYSEFPWHDWIAQVDLSNVSNTSGKSIYSDFTDEVVELTAGENFSLNLTAGFSYFTWDEYWRIWIDFNSDGDFSDSGELVFSDMLPAPANGTFNASLFGILNIPDTAPVGMTRMRISMKRGDFPNSCEVIPFGEVEDYTVNIAPPIQYPNLLIPQYEVIPGNGNCFTNPGESFGYLGGTLLNNGEGDVEDFNLVATISVDEQPSPDDILWEEFQYTGLDANSAAGFNVSNPVPASLPVGRYYIILSIDPEQQVIETTTLDNIVTIPIYIGAPDFAVHEIIDYPANTTEGSGFEVTVQIENLVGFPLMDLPGDLPVKIYLSEDAGFSLFSDLEIGSANIAYDQFSNGPLFQNGIAATTVMVQLPMSIIPDDYYLFAYVEKYCEQPLNNNVSDPYPIQIGNVPIGVYCHSYGEFPWHEWIAGVEMSNLSNESGKSKYADFTSAVADVWAGQTYTINLTAGFSYFTWDEYWSVWIDFNKDGDFVDYGELVFADTMPAPPNGTLKSSLLGQVAIPANAAAGTTRMRIAMKRGAFANPCEIYPYGEVEDYTISVNSGCYISVATGNVKCQDAGTPNDPNDDTFTFEVLATGTGISQHWSMNWPGGSASGFFSIVQEVGPLLITDFQNGLTFTLYDNSNAACAASNVVIPPPSCSAPIDDYCEPYSSFPWHDWITAVEINDLENYSGKSVYSDFTHLSGSLEKDVWYDIALTAGYSYLTWDEYWSVWIDLNQDNIFQDTAELVYSGVLSAPPNGSASATLSGGFKLSETVLTGETRMRVVMKREGYAGPCENIPFGEIEDYTIFIIDKKPGQGIDNRASNIDFKAVLEKDWVNLYGAFKFPETVSQIEIEKSDDGLMFNLLETLSGNFISNERQHFEVKDKSPYDGINYYRVLFLIDNGDEIYGETVPINFRKPLNFTLFPNPANNEVFIYLDDLDDKQLDLEINDASGSVLWQRTLRSDTMSPLRIDISSLKQGFYYLFIKGEDRKAVSQKFVVVR